MSALLTHNELSRYLILPQPRGIRLSDFYSLAMPVSASAQIISITTPSE